MTQPPTMSVKQSGHNYVTQTSVSWALQGSPPSGGLLLKDNNVHAVTSGAAQILGLKEGDGLSLPLDALPRPLVTLIQDSFSGASVKFKQQVEVSIPGKPTTLVEVTTLLCPEKNQNKHLLLFLRDVGFSTEMRRRLTHLDRLLTLGTLSANVTHELRNAFVAIKTFVELLLEKNQDADLAGLVQRELARIDELLTQALKIAEPALPAISIIGVNDVLERTLKLLEPTLRKTRIILQKSLAAHPDWIEGAENEIQQVFMNLILNAIEAMGEAGNLRITSMLSQSTGEPQPRITISIKDSGPGITPEHQARLFEPFFTTKPGGTGLGLAITHRIMAEHQATIQFSTNSQGTEFTLDFPLAAESR